MDGFFCVPLVGVLCVYVGVEYVLGYAYEKSIYLWLLLCTLVRRFVCLRWCVGRDTLRQRAMCALACCCGSMVVYWVTLFLPNLT